MSNILPRNSGTQMRAMFDRMVGSDPRAYMSLDAAKKHARTTGDVLRNGGEATVIGAVLGIVNASRGDGLDIRIPGVSKVGAPIDGIAALGFGIAAIAAAQEDYSKDFVNASGAAAAIFAFRKTSDMVTAMNASKSGATPGGGATTGNAGGRISKATFGGEGDGVRWGRSIVGAHDEHDAIVIAGRRL